MERYEGVVLEKPKLGGRGSVSHTRVIFNKSQMYRKRPFSALPHPLTPSPSSFQTIFCSCHFTYFLRPFLSPYARTRVSRCALHGAGHHHSSKFIPRKRQNSHFFRDSVRCLVFSSFRSLFLPMSENAFCTNSRILLKVFLFKSLACACQLTRLQ